MVQSRFYSTTGGNIQINTIIPDSYPWIGEYYEDIPISVKAIPDSGFTFVGWPQYPDSGASMNVPVYEDFNLTAFFTSSLSEDTIDLVINEINYHSLDSFNTGDWIEACTAITEDRDGSFELKSFSKAKSVLINKL